MQLFRHKMLVHFLVVALGLTPGVFPGVAIGDENQSSYASSGASTMADEDQYSYAPSAEHMLADLILVRPIMLVGTALGTAAFLVSLPFTALGGNVDEAKKRLVEEPGSYTFTRPLGDLRRYR